MNDSLDPFRFTRIVALALSGCSLLGGAGFAAPVIVGHSGGNGSIVTFDFATGGTPLASFLTTGASIDSRGRAVEVIGNIVYYAAVSGDIHLAPYNGGLGGPDSAVLLNPRPGFGVQDLDYMNGVLYALTGYPSGLPIVYGLDPTTGAVLNSVAIQNHPGTQSDGFTVLPNGDFLINDNDAVHTYRSYDSTTGMPTGLVITVPALGSNTSGVDFNPGDNNLYFSGFFGSGPGLGRTNLTGAFLGSIPTSGVVEDISVLTTESGANKDFCNNTAVNVETFEIVTAGVHPTVSSHYDGPYPGTPGSIFSSFSVTPSGANTILRWTGFALAGGMIAPGQCVHVGFTIPGPTVTVLEYRWLAGGAKIGCVKQIQLGQGYSHLLQGQVTFANDLTKCSPGTVYVGDVLLEYHAKLPRISELNRGVSRHPMRRETIRTPPIPLPPGSSRRIAVPVPPAGAQYAVVIFRVNDNPANVGGKGSTLDFVLAPLQSAPPASSPAWRRWGLILLFALLLVAGATAARSIRRARSSARPA